MHSCVILILALMVGQVVVGVHLPARDDSLIRINLTKQKTSSLNKDEAIFGLQFASGGREQGDCSSAQQDELEQNQGNQFYIRDQGGHTWQIVSRPAGFRLGRPVAG